MRYIEILNEDFKTAARKYIEFGAKPDDVSKTIEEFKQIRQRVQPPENNIDWWAKNRTFAQLQEYIRNFEGIPTKSQVGKKTGRSINIIENSEWLITVPLDKDASCFHGKTTDWCTTKPFQSHYEEYFYDNSITLIYCIQKNTGEKWAIASHKHNLDDSEYFDKNDKPLNRSEFENQTKLSVDMILGKAFGNNIQSEVTNSREQYLKAIKRIRELIDEVRKSQQRNAELEKLLWYTKHQDYLQMYMSLIGPDNFNKNLELYAVSAIPNSIIYIKNPSERIQMISAKKDGDVTLSYLVSTIGEDNISDKVKMEAVKNDGVAIKRLKNIYDDFGKKLQLAAVSNWGQSLKSINNPDDEVIKAAINQNGLAIQFVDNIEDKELQKIAIDNSVNSILIIIRNSKVLYDDIIIDAIMKTNDNPKFSANDILDELLKQKKEIKPEYIDAFVESTDDVREVIQVLKQELGYMLTPNQQVKAFENDVTSLIKMLALYGDDNVSAETLINMSKIKELGLGFLETLYRYMGLGNRRIDIPEQAIENAFRYSIIDERMLSYLKRLKITPSLTVLKYAVQNGRHNWDVIAAINYGIETDPKYEEPLKKIALNRAKIDNNKMLMQLVNEI